MYLVSSIGVRAKRNLDILDAAAAVLNSLSGRWVLGGDFNCTPEQLTETGWLRVVGGVIVAPKATTCLDRTIDFFVVSAAMAHMVQGAHVIGDALGKPHWPVRLLMNGRARPCMTRQLKGPKLFGACLPFGPAVKPHPPPMRLQDRQEKEGEDDRPIEELAVDFKGWLNLMELELIAVAGLEGKQAESHRGRAEGPKYEWVDQSRCETAGPAPRTTSVSRA